MTVQQQEEEATTGGRSADGVVNRRWSEELLRVDGLALFGLVLLAGLF